MPPLHLRQDSREVRGQQGLAAGDMETGGKINAVGIPPGRQHVSRFLDDRDDLRKGQFLTPRRGFLITVSAPQVAAFREMPLDKKFVAVDDWHKAISTAGPVSSHPARVEP